MIDKAPPNKSCGIMIGAGVRVIPTHFILFEKLINLVHEHAPHAKFCFNTNPTDTQKQYDVGFEQSRNDGLAMSGLLC